MRAVMSLLGLFATSAALSFAPASDKAPAILGRQIGEFALPDSTGVSVEASKFKNAKALVVVFVGTECPISNAFMPRLAELSKEYAPKGVQFLAVNANRQDSPGRVAEHTKESRLP